MKPAAADDRCSVSGLVSTEVTELATVISSPSRIHATPSATTIRVWNGDQGSRSIRAGMRLRMAPDVGAASYVLVIERLRADLVCRNVVPPPEPDQSQGRSRLPVCAGSRCRPASYPRVNRD